MIALLAQPTRLRETDTVVWNNAQTLQQLGDVYAINERMPPMTHTRLLIKSSPALGRKIRGGQARAGVREQGKQGKSGHKRRGSKGGRAHGSGALAGARAGESGASAVGAGEFRGGRAWEEKKRAGAEKHPNSQKPHERINLAEEYKRAHERANTGGRTQGS